MPSRNRTASATIARCPNVDLVGSALLFSRLLIIFFSSLTEHLTTQSYIMCVWRNLRRCAQRHSAVLRSALFYLCRRRSTAHTTTQRQRRHRTFLQCVVVRQLARLTHSSAEQSRVHMCLCVCVWGGGSPAQQRWVGEHIVGRVNLWSSPQSEYLCVCV